MVVSEEDRTDEHSTANIGMGGGMQADMGVLLHVHTVRHTRPVKVHSDEPLIGSTMGDVLCNIQLLMSDGEV
jgi:hypothetical protein